MMSTNHKSVSKLVVVGVVLGLCSVAATQAAPLSAPLPLTPALSVMAAAHPDAAEQGWLARLTDLWQWLWGQPGAPGDIRPGAARHATQSETQGTVTRPTHSAPALPDTQPCGAGGGGDEASGPWP